MLPRPVAGDNSLTNGSAVLSLLIATGVLPGCGTLTGDSSVPGERPLPAIVDPSSAIPTGPEAEYSEDGLVRVETPDGMYLYVKTPRPRLQRYDSMIVAVPNLTYQTGSALWSERQEKEMLDSFHDKLVDTIESGEFWTRTNQRSPSTLIMKATVGELDLQTAPTDLGAQSSTTIVQASGGALLGFELFDSTTEEPLMRFFERRRLPGGVFSGSDVEDQRMRRIFREFARDISRQAGAKKRIDHQLCFCDAFDGQRHHRAVP